MILDRRSCLAVLVLICVQVTSVLYGQESPPLHQQIDEAIAQAHLGNLAETADDYEFLRRLYLNLLGRIPSISEVEAFVDSREELKRTQTIDQLLHSSEFEEHFASVFDVMFMERRTGNRVANNEWQAFLKKALQKNGHLTRSFNRFLLLME